MKTIAKISEETLKIVNYLQAIPHGQILTYAQIQKDTDVEMSNSGKSYLRTALRKLKREYSCIHGIGIELASVKTATGIVVNRLVKIDKAVKRGEKTYKNMIVEFYNELPIREQKQINFIGAAFGAIRVAAENGRFYLKNTQASQSIPILPENIK
jgi:hypothetical protein